MTLSQSLAPSASKAQFVLRFPGCELRKQLKVRAASNERSMNAEILYLIKRGMEAEHRPKGAQQ